GDWLHGFRRQPGPLGAPPGCARHAAGALRPGQRSPAGPAAGVRRCDADGQDARGGWRRGPARPRGRACRLPLARRAPPGGRGVLREEELILVAVVGGSALLILGILELIWPSTPRHPVRRPQPARAPPASPAKTATPARTAAPATPMQERHSQVSPYGWPHAGPADPVWSRESL